MRKFRFALEGIERLRARDVRTHEVELAKTRDALAQAETAREGAASALKRSVAQAPAGTVIHVRHLLELDAERRRLTGELQREEKRLEGSSLAMESEMVRLLEARRGARAVEMLRGRRYEEFLQAVRQEEQKMTDEVAARIVRESRVA
jgi:flagellar biosynthesis chaperone FliJ